MDRVEAIKAQALTAIQTLVDQATPAVRDAVEKVRPHAESALAAVDPHFSAAAEAADGHLSRLLRPWQIAAVFAAGAAVLSGALGATFRKLTVLAALTAVAWAAAVRNGLVEGGKVASE